MSARSVVAGALGLFVAVSVGIVILDEFTRSDPVTGPLEQFQGDRIVAYYFHGNVRCATCNSIEAHAREALETGFADELRSGRIVWRTLNFEDPANASYRDRYVIVSSTLVLSDVRGGEERDSVELDEVWTRVVDKDDFVKYVQREVSGMLESAP